MHVLLHMARVFDAREGLNMSIRMTAEDELPAHVSSTSRPPAYLPVIICRSATLQPDRLMQN